MRKSLTLFKEVETGCGKCHRSFSSKVPIAVNIKTDPDLLNEIANLNLLNSTCPHCGFRARNHVPFIYHDPERNLLWLVIPDFMDTRYQQVHGFFESILEEYTQAMSTKEKSSLLKLSRSIVPLAPFLFKIESPIVQNVGLGAIHFYPFPIIDLPLGKAVRGKSKDKECFDQFEVGMLEGNYPDFYQSLWTLSNSEFQYGRSYLHSKDIKQERKPAVTHGVQEILFYIGSSVIVPIFVGVLSNLITQLVIQKRKAKTELEAQLKRAKKKKGKVLFQPPKLYLFSS